MFFVQGLLKPRKSLVLWFQGIITWERPASNIILIVLVLLVIYKWVPECIFCNQFGHWDTKHVVFTMFYDSDLCREWVGKAIAALLLGMVANMFILRRRRIQSNYEKIVICTTSDQSTMESIVSAQQGLRTVHEVMQQTNIAVLKLWSILSSRSPKVRFFCLTENWGLTVKTQLNVSHHSNPILVMGALLRTSKAQLLPTLQKDQKIKNVPLKEKKDGNEIQTSLSFWLY